MNGRNIRSPDNFQSTGMRGRPGQDAYWTPLCSLRANIQVPHIKQSVPLKWNKHPDTYWVVKREDLQTDNKNLQRDKRTCRVNS